MKQQDSLLQLPLHSLHLRLGAKIVPFAGFEMPVSYPKGIVKEHRHSREQAGLFDVSHMGQIDVRGQNIAARLESELPVDLVSLGVNRQKYALLLNDAGGIRDDLIVINRGDYFQLVVNAACKQEDLAYLQARFGHSLNFQLRDECAMLAIQGPASAEALIAVGANINTLTAMKFMHVADMQLAGTNCRVSRSGYTGEDGFEISARASQVYSLAEELLEQQIIQPVGLGARDSLRLEAGLCLHGQDITPETTPVEAGLGWSISASRRSGGARQGGFPGADRILKELNQGISRRLVGLLPAGRSPMRAGTPLLDETGELLGSITSGGFGPTLQCPVSMGYVSVSHATPGTRLLGEVRGKHQPITVTKMPFVPHQYYR